MARHTAADDPAPSRVFVDSSAWFAVASASDGRHGEADALLRRAVAAQTTLLTTNLVLAEIHRVLDFQEIDPATGLKTPVSGLSRAVPAVQRAALRALAPQAGAAITTAVSATES